MGPEDTFPPDLHYMLQIIWAVQDKNAHELVELLYPNAEKEQKEVAIECVEPTLKPKGRPKGAADKHLDLAAWFAVNEAERLREQGAQNIWHAAITHAQARMKKEGFPARSFQQIKDRALYQERTKKAAHKRHQSKWDQHG